MIDPGLFGYHESRRCSRDTYPESCITKYTNNNSKINVSYFLCADIKTSNRRRRHPSQRSSRGPSPTTETRVLTRVLMDVLMDVLMVLTDVLTDVLTVTSNRKQQRRSRRSSRGPSRTTETRRTSPRTSTSLSWTACAGWREASRSYIQIDR